MKTIFPATNSTRFNLSLSQHGAWLFLNGIESAVNELPGALDSEELTLKLDTLTTEATHLHAWFESYCGYPVEDWHPQFKALEVAIDKLYEVANE